MKLKNFLDQTNLNKVKLSILSASITALICSGVYASDIDIYKAPPSSAGATTVMMMLDVSGSMRVTHPTREVAWKACDLGYINTNKNPSYTSPNKKINVDGVDITYKRYICSDGSKADRITRLKDAMVTLMLGDTKNDIPALDDKIILGVSTLGAVKDGTEETKAGGRILVAARPLSEKVNDGGTLKTQRRLILEKVLAINPVAATPTANSYAETIAYLMGKSTSNHKNTGWSYSTGTGIKTSGGNSYNQPTAIKSQLNATDEQKQCSAQGIYVLTDGDPNENSGTEDLAKTALSPNSFSCSGTGAGWDCVYKMNQSLLDPTKNPAKVKFITSIIGFGSDFNTIPSSAQTEVEVNTYTNVSANVRNAAIWGIRGEGGWYSGDSAEDVVESFNQFLKKVKTDIPGVSTGNATLPIDALNSNAIQPYGYFPQFVPKVANDQTQQTWYGNLKRYYAVQGSLYGNKDGTNPVMQKDEIKNIIDLWHNSEYVTTSNETAFKDGALSNLLQGYVENRSPKERLLLTDFSYKDKVIAQDLNVSWFDTADQKIKFNAISTQYNLDSTAPYRQALMNLLGFENAMGGEDLTSVLASGKVPQIGAVLHSKPILLTQSGLPEVTGTSSSAIIDTKNRDDYILFGSTQGVLHVVDADDGKEVFAFVPKEMIEYQSQAFALEGGTDLGGKNKLYYGIDGEWTAHTVYVSDKNGKLTVDGGSRTIENDEGKEETINLKGKQWVYGGLRMGGRSYYSLDLTDIHSPKIKFQIDPNHQQVHYLDGSSTKSKTIEELKYMGQSWSKPTLAYVDWFGTRKLVMIVGGGYDAGSTDGLTADGDGLYTTKTVNGHLVKDKRNGYAGYENADYIQNNKIGAGVYMFDADNGDLLWSVSGNNTVTTTTDKTNLKLNGSAANMNFSVVSDIKTVDRNNDGLVDHLYFGDLNGQAFRVDFAPTDKAFNSQVNRILDLSATHKRFYAAPTFTIHSQGTAVVSFASGNKSQPLHGYATPTLATEDHDGIFAVYDYDVYASLFPTGAFPVRSLGSNTSTAINQLKLIESRVDSSDSVNNTQRPKISSTVGNGGWYYLYNKEETINTSNGSTVITTKNKQVLKTLGSLVAVESDLYVPVFDSSKAGTTGSCSAGVAGETALQRFCLPYGICKENIYIPLGAGIGEPIIGGGRDGDPNKRSIFVLNEDKKGGAGNFGGNTQIKNYGSALKFIPNRWYERYALGGG